MMGLHTRLTLWYVLALCLGLALFGGAVLWQTDRSARDALDATVLQRALDVTADLRVDRGIVLRPDTPDEGAGSLGDVTLWVRVLDTRGRVVVRQGPPLSGVPAALLATTRIGMYERELIGDRHIHLVVRPVIYQGRRVATVQVYVTTAQIDAARQRLLVAMGLAGVLIVVGAALGGLILANRALRPVDRITRLAGQIGMGELHRRVGEAVPERDDELGRLARTFDAMLARLEEADERRRRFTADAAHELGTPIATITSGAEIALRHPRRPDEYQDVLRHILAEGRHMGRLVDDLLLLARADAGRLPMDREIVEIDEVCRQTLRAVQPLAEARAVVLWALLPPRALLVEGDERRLGQVVRNLLDNALRHTPSGGSVTLTVGQESGRDGLDRVIVVVEDTGPGVALHERAHIFERFHRDESNMMVRSDNPDGHGLGLAICKAIVVAHGGQIRVEDSQSGARFVVELPALARE